MDSGQIYRSIIYRIWQTSFGLLLTAILFIGAETFLFPGFIDPILMLIVMIFLLLGFLGVFVGTIFGVPIYRAESKALHEIEQVISEIGTKESLWSSVQPAYLLADSIDREFLMTIKETGGNILSIEEGVSRQAFATETGEIYRRLAKLHLLGLVIVSKEHRLITLTSLGLEAINIPAVLFVSKIPQNIWGYVFQQKIALSQEKWGVVVVETAKAIEAILKDKLTEMIDEDSTAWDEIKEGLPKREIEKWPAGNLLEGLKKGGQVKANSFEDYLVLELIKMRNLIHDKKETHTFGPNDADKCDIYLNLILRLWYGFR